ncbi:hypothetical protein CCH79_00007747 [Gambusia affinis]|uniref:ADF-H domain-containing protein n=1 Tax=Gambusia affinis TaxID=33528 RepID=A0A315W1W5_GAMAF|nr:hypothetical protein CCH79_00007747 [Gambusia affinis]
MKVRKSSTQEEVRKRKKAVLFCLSEDRKKIIVEEGKQILVGDIGETVEDPYGCFVKLLPSNDCRYALYDATYETRESKKEDLVFIFWAPESAPLKSKMIYASSKDAIKKKFTGEELSQKASTRSAPSPCDSAWQRVGLTATVRSVRRAWISPGQLGARWSAEQHHSR